MKGITLEEVKTLLQYKHWVSLALDPMSFVKDIVRLRDAKLSHELDNLKVVPNQRSLKHKASCAVYDPTSSQCDCGAADKVAFVSLEEVKKLLNT